MKEISYGYNPSLNYKAWDFQTQNLSQVFSLGNEIVYWDDYSYHLQFVVKQSDDWIQLLNGTGLLDINQKEIFRHDIVKTLPTLNNFLYDDLIEYKEGEIEWLVDGWYTCEAGISSTKLGKYMMCDCCNSQLEIIGNKYEIR